MAPVSRRAFLKTGLSVAGVAALPTIIPSRVWAAQGNAAPNNRINLGIIGLGKLGRESHLEAFLNIDEVQVLALCDVEESRLQTSKQRTEEFYAGRNETAKYSGCTTYHDFRELLARDDIDAVVVVTPDHWHAIPAVLAAKAGKDIYCEKPLTRFIKDGRAIVDAVRRYGRVFQTGSQQRSEYDNYFSRAAELVRAKVIGDITRVDIGVGGFPQDTYGLPPDPVPATLDWDRWQGPAPARPYTKELCPMNFPGFPNWRSYSDYAGGGFSDFGAHHFDIAQWALGMDHTGPVEVLPPNGKDVERMTFLYANGIPMYHGGEADCVFHGTKGKIMVSRSSLKADPMTILDYRLEHGDTRLNRHKDHRQDWLDCIRTRDLPIADVEIGHRTSTVCQLGNICHVVNRPLKWDPEKEEFINDPEANRLLKRPGRGEWDIC